MNDDVVCAPLCPCQTFANRLQFCFPARILLFLITKCNEPPEESMSDPLRKRFQLLQLQVLQASRLNAENKLREPYLWILSSGDA